MASLSRFNGACIVSLVLLQLITVSGLQADGSVIFVDSSIRPVHFRKTHSTERVAFSGTAYRVGRQSEAFSFDDVATSVAVLLGVVPDLRVDEDVSDKLDSVISPSPFHRPRAVLSLNIGGVESDVISNGENLDMLGVKSYQQRTFGAEVSHFNQISGDDVNVHLLTNLDAVDLQAKVTEQDLELAFMSASYNLDGDSSTVTTISWDLSNGESFSLDMSKNVDYLFFKELMGIFRNMQRAIVSQHAGDLERPADLYFGTFNGIEELRKVYGSGQQTRLASKFVLYSINQALEFFQTSYNEKLVGVFTFTKDDNDFEITTRKRQVRILQDAAVAPAAGNETDPDQRVLKLGNQAVVFFTVIILIVALLLSTCCMFTMPVTKDSLLYSGLKLD